MCDVYIYIYIIYIYISIRYMYIYVYIYLYIYLYIYIICICYVYLSINIPPYIPTSHPIIYIYISSPALNNQCSASHSLQQSFVLLSFAL